MRYKELPKKWKVIAALLIIVNILLIVLFIGFDIFLHAYRKNCAELRAPLKKDDSLLVGERICIGRDKKDDVAVDLYIPDNLGAEKLPVIFNIHGGGFVGGDAAIIL